MLFPPSPRITFGYIVPRYQSSLAAPSASKSFERVLCCCTRNCCWFILFMLLISLSATCFAFASGLANILVSPTTCLVLGGVPDNARVMGCTCANSPSNYSSTTLDGVPSRVSWLFLMLLSLRH